MLYFRRYCRTKEILMHTLTHTCTHTHTPTHPCTRGEKETKLREISLDPFNLIGGEGVGDGNLVERVVVTEVAEHRLWRLNEVDQHRLKAIATEIVEGNLRFVVGERTAGSSHHVHLPLLLVTNLDITHTEHIIVRIMHSIPFSVQY